MKLKALLSEDKRSLNIKISVGDVLYMGRFKNKKIIVKTISFDEYGQPMINGRKLLTGRLEKLIPKNK